MKHWGEGMMINFLGTLGHAGVFSLDFAKTITTGEGGLIVTNDAKIEKYCEIS